MNIDRSGANVTVRVDNAELSELGLNFDSLKERDISAKIFLAALRAQIMLKYGADIGKVNVYITSSHDNFGYQRNRSL